MEKEKIKFKELSWPIKVAVVGFWVGAIWNSLWFIVGFTIGMVEVLNGVI